MKSLIDTILSETDYVHNPYFLSLKDGSFDRSDFLETQAQFYFAVVFFSRPMAAVAAKIPDASMRLAILRNVWEEHGEGNLSLAHGKTFLTFLNRLGGLTKEEIERRPLWPEVRAFNTALVGAAVLDESLVSIGVMGMIERMFCDISSWIGQGVIERGWHTSEDLIHYNLHEELDIRHSQDFFDCLMPSWKKNDEDRYYIEQGLRLGAYLFDRLYSGLFESRIRRDALRAQGHDLHHSRIR